MTVTIYHNPRCGTSRNTLGMIRQAGIEPTIIEYLKTPPDREKLTELVEAMGITPRELLREKEAVCKEMGLTDPDVSDDALIDAMLREPILINRPIVVGPRGVKLCRPSEMVGDVLPEGALAKYTKEDGEIVGDSNAGTAGTAGSKP